MALTDPATAAQMKVMAEQAASMALAEYGPQISQIERAVARLSGAVPDEGMKTIGPVAKWGAGIAATLLSAIILASLFWVAGSVTDMQQTLARIDERQKAQTEQLDSRFADYDRRLTRLERYHQLEGSGS